MGTKRERQQQAEQDLSGEPHSELGHTPEQVRQIRETGVVPEPKGKREEGVSMTNVSQTGATTTTTTTAAPGGSRSSERDQTRFEGDDDDQIPFAGSDRSGPTTTTTTTKEPKKG
jgi:hypothetical protein